MNKFMPGMAIKQTISPIHHNWQPLYLVKMAQQVKSITTPLFVLSTVITYEDKGRSLEVVAD